MVKHVVDRYYFTKIDIGYTILDFDIQQLSWVEMFDFSLYNGDFNNGDFKPIMDVLVQFKYLIALTVPCKYDQMVTQFSSKLLEFNLGDEYNHPLENLPTCLIKLLLNDIFDQQTYGILPLTIVIISIRTLSK